MFDLLLRGIGVIAGGRVTTLEFRRVPNMRFLMLLLFWNIALFCYSHSLQIIQSVVLHIAY
jgi:hypothetical protein